MAGIAIAVGVPTGVKAATGIGTNATVNASTLGTNDVALQGGTLKVDRSAAYSNNVTLQGSNSATITSTIDTAGNAGTFSGTFSNDTSTSFPGALVIADSVGGGKITLTGANNYTGATTINSGASLALSGTGTISSSSSLTDNGTFDISQAASGASLASLAGSGSVLLGAQTLTITNSSGTFSGVISGSGGLLINGGTQVLDSTQTYTGGTTVSRGTLQIGAGDSNGMILGNVAVGGTLAFDRTDDISFDGLISGSGAVSQLGGGTLTLTKIETYSGTTTISAGTLALSGGASIAGSAVATDGTFDISATSGASVRSLSGTGTVQLGAANLVLTAATGTFSGVIAGSGGIVLNAGTEILTGANTYTGSTTVNGGILEMGAAVITNNVTNNGTFGFYSSGAIAMSGVVSGAGAVIQVGSGTTTISTAQTYTGSTTISSGALALSGLGSIASSSNVIDNGTFSIGAATGDVTIASLSGVGTVQLGATNLILANASGTFSGAISGSGGLTLAGGKETLSGSSSFTGPTTIASGTLYLTAASVLPSSRIIDNGTLDISGVTNTGVQTTSAILSLSGNGAVALGGATLILTSGADTFAGTISGTGGLTITGGSETLTGVNSYTGATTIKSGTLILSGAGSLATTGTVADGGIFDISAASSGGTVTIGSLSGTGTLILGTNSLNLSAAADSFSGTISGAGGLIISGGTQTLSGSNSYTGGTIISSGTLQIGNGVTNGSIVGDVTDNGTVAFNQLSATTYAGRISGTGTVVQNGTGTVSLTGANTYSGGTTITAGTLQIGNGGASGAIAGDVVDNGILAFDRSDSIVFAGTISGNGGVSQVGSGDVTLLAANSYTGTTTINSTAELSLSGAGSIAASSNVVVNGLLDLTAANASSKITSLAGSGTVQLGNQAIELTGATGTFAGNIAGLGNLIVSGGNETLSGNSSYTGATQINAGTLTVNGSIASAKGVTVNAGGTLAGNGVVPSVTVNSGGTVAPGVGTLKVNGGITFSSGSNYLVQLGSGSSSKLSVSGSAALGGTLTVASADGTYALGQKVAVLTADGGTSGTFVLAPIASSGAEFAGHLSYDANSAYLEIDLAKLSPLLSSSATANQASVVKAIDAAIAANNVLPTQFNNLGNLSSAGLSSAADQTSGEIGSDLRGASNSLIDPFVNAINDHLTDAQPSALSAKQDSRRKQIEVWASGLFGTGIIGGDLATVGSHKFKSKTASFAGGIDWSVSPNLVVGGALSLGRSDFHLTSDLGQGAVDAYQVAGYGLMQFSPRTYGSLTTVLSLDNMTTNRTVTVAGNDKLNGKTDALMFGGRYETGIKLGWISPYIAFQDKLFNAPGYSETASSGASTFALRYKSQTVNSAGLEIGARQRADIPIDGIWTLQLTDRLAWANDLSGTSKTEASFVALPASSFTTLGASAAKNAVLVSLGARLKNKSGFNLDIHLDSSAAANAQTYTGIMGLNIAW